MKLRRLGLIGALSFCAACASVPQAGPCEAKEWLGTIRVAKRASIADVKPKYLSIVDIKTAPAAAKEGVLQWIDVELRRIENEIRPSDEIWYFREEKCPGCGWYREGYSLIRGCTIVDEITLSDDV